MTAAKLIETLMRDLDLNQTELGAVMGVSQSAVSRMLGGKLSLTGGAICRIYSHTYYKPDRMFAPLHDFLVSEGRRLKRG